MVDISNKLYNLMTFLSVGSVWVSIAGAAFAWFVFLLIPASVDVLTCVAVALICFAVYSLDKVADIEKDQLPGRAAFLKGKGTAIKKLAIVAYILAAIIVGVGALWIVVIPITINLFYARYFKKIPAIKNIVVGLVGAAVIAGLPLHSAGVISGATLIFVFIKISIGAALFDLRDIEADRVNGIKTIPVLVGRSKTIMSFLVIESFLWVVAWSIGPLVAASIIYEYIILLYFLRDRGVLAYDLLIEGEWIWLVLGVIIISL